MIYIEQIRDIIDIRTQIIQFLKYVQCLKYIITPVIKIG